MSNHTIDKKWIICQMRHQTGLKHVTVALGRAVSLLGRSIRSVSPFPNFYVLNLSTEFCFATTTQPIKTTRK